MPRPVRLAAAALGVAAIATVLTACDKPTPRVTFLSGSTTVVVRPQTYCFDVQHCRVDTSSPVSSIKARPGTSMLVDVPRQVAAETWSVVAATEGTDQKFTQLQVDGASSGSISNEHSTRVVVPYASGSYYLIVRQESGGKDTATWIAKVSVSA